MKKVKFLVTMVLALTTIISTGVAQNSIKTIEAETKVNSVERIEEKTLDAVEIEKDPEIKGDSEVKEETGIIEQDESKGKNEDNKENIQGDKILGEIITQGEMQDGNRWSCEAINPKPEEVSDYDNEVVEILGSEDITTEEELVAGESRTLKWKLKGLKEGEEIVNLNMQIQKKII